MNISQILVMRTVDEETLKVRAFRMTCLLSLGMSESEAELINSIMMHLVFYRERVSSLIRGHKMEIKQKAKLQTLLS